MWDKQPLYPKTSTEAYVNRLWANNNIKQTLSNMYNKIIGNLYFFWHFLACHGIVFENSWHQHVHVYPCTCMCMCVRVVTFYCHSLFYKIYQIYAMSSPLSWYSTCMASLASFWHFENVTWFEPLVNPVMNKEGGILKSRLTPCKAERRIARSQLSFERHGAQT